jgi:hypothetical protein
LLACKRLLLKLFIYDFNMESIYVLFGVPMLGFGVAYGTYNWIYYLGLRKGAPTGTVVIPAMLIILGLQFLLSAIGLDLQGTPKTPMCSGPLPTEESRTLSGGRLSKGDSVA